MVRFDATESLTPFRSDAGRLGAILSDAAVARQVERGWFDPGYWKDKAQTVDAGGRGGAWYVDTPLAPAVLRHYLRGGMVARLNRETHLWRGARRVRSFEEFRLLRKLGAMGLPVPRAIAASYVRTTGLGYRASILLERLQGVQTFDALVTQLGDGAPWEDCGRLIARFHRAGLDHIDLNARNILYDGNGRGWLIDFDRSRLRLQETKWRRDNLQRLRRSLRKWHGDRRGFDVEAGFARLQKAYDARWDRGY